jgi:Tfp pilus assembly protein PilF
MNLSLMNLSLTLQSSGRRTSGVMGRRRWRLLLGVLLGLAGPALAAPFVPTAPEQVLERLPLAASDSQARELQGLRRQLASQPHDLELALRVARRNLEIGRAEADPRYYGYVQAALAPWWSQNPPPPEVLLLRAVLRQNRHDFDGALVDLRQVLAVRPHHAQAWLTQAVIQQVRGEPAAALKSCLALRRLANPLLFDACASGALGRGGQVEFAYASLRRALEDAPGADAEERLWAMTVLAELAEQRGDAQAAETHFRDALALGRRSVYLLGAYADFLLDRDRSAEARDLLRDEQRADSLLLRLALAERRLDDPAWQRHTEILEARFAAARQRGDGTHVASEARLKLDLRQQPGEALELARRNWAQGQREPRDARLLLEAALAAGQPEAAREVLDWLTRVRLEDRRLVELNRLLREPSS